MNELKIFYLNGCPYCRNAWLAYEELLTENAEWRDVPVTWLEEGEHPEITEEYDYYYVPTIFMDRQKMFETNPGWDYDRIKSELKKALITAGN